MCLSSWVAVPGSHLVGTPLEGLDRGSQLLRVRSARGRLLDSIGTNAIDARVCTLKVFLTEPRYLHVPLLLAPDVGALSTRHTQRVITQRNRNMSRPMFGLTVPPLLM